MKNLLIVLFFVLVIFSCTRHETLSGPLKNQVMAIASEFAASRIDSATIISDNSGVVRIGDEIVRYIINPESIFYEEIDEKKGKEILITIDSLHDPYLMPVWHLILNKEKNGVKTINVIRSDMRVLSIDNQLIEAEIPTHSPNSPLYYCSECRDTVSYRIVNGKLVLRDNPVLN